MYIITHLCATNAPCGLEIPQLAHPSALKVLQGTHSRIGAFRC